MPERMDSLSLDPAKLRESVFFSGLSDADILLVCRSGVSRKVPVGEYIFIQGDPAERVYLLLHGRIKLTQSGADGQQVLVRILGPNGLFGAVALSAGEMYPVTAEAADDCRTLSWTKQVIMDFIPRLPQLALNTIQMMAGHVMEFQDRFRQLATERVERRLARTLLRLASQTGRKVDEGVLIDLPLTRQDLAEMTGTTLYTVSRLLSQWEEHGLVISGRERVVIRFPHGLVSIAEDLPRPD